MTVTGTQKFALDIASNIIVNAGPKLAKNDRIRKRVAGAVEQKMMDGLEATRKGHKYPPGVNDDRTAFGLALVKTAERALKYDTLSKAALRGVFDIAVKTLMLEQGDRGPCEVFREQYGTHPPAFLVISPSKACNLRCTGCYADSGANSEKLAWSTVDRIVEEAKTKWGARFIVVSGGEPLAYHSDGKGILDIAEKHNDCLFLMYTNSTLITEDMAAKLGRMGNLTPAISLEGWKERTDARRGAGMYDKILTSMARLRNYGVPFGVSLTATRSNFQEILSDEFIDYFFFEQRALYGWLFQYMPIGRKFTLDLMPTPQQRLWMWRQSQELIRKKGIFLADFWNHGSLCEGCVSAGRDTGGGYLYIDWNGAVSPCVFVPYSPVNVNKVFADGGDMNDIWNDPFFAAIRSWQTEHKQTNVMMPCPNRDHNQDLRRMIAQFEPDPTDDNARAALLDADYAAGLDAYDREYAQLAEPIWRSYYLGENGPQRDGQLGELPRVSLAR